MADSEGLTHQSQREGGRVEVDVTADGIVEVTLVSPEGDSFTVGLDNDQAVELWLTLQNAVIAARELDA